MRPAAVLLQLVGLVALIVGAFLLAAWLGFVVGGVCVFGVGLLMEHLVIIPKEEADGARTEQSA